MRSTLTPRRNLLTCCCISAVSLVVTATITLADDAPRPARTWTDIEGRKITASLVDFDTNEVRLRLQSDSKVYTVPLERLSPADRAYVKSLREAKPALPGDKVAAYVQHALAMKDKAKAYHALANAAMFKHREAEVKQALTRLPYPGVVLFKDGETNPDADALVEATTRMGKALDVKVEELAARVRPSAHTDQIEAAMLLDTELTGDGLMITGNLRDTPIVAFVRKPGLSRTEIRERYGNPTATLTSAAGSQYDFWGRCFLVSWAKGELLLFRLLVKPETRQATTAGEIALAPRVRTPLGDCVGIVKVHRSAIRGRSFTDGTYVEGEFVPRYIYSTIGVRPGRTFIYVHLRNAASSAEYFEAGKCRIVADGERCRPIASKHHLNDEYAWVFHHHEKFKTAATHSYLLFVVPLSATNYEFVYSGKSVRLPFP